MDNSDVIEFRVEAVRARLLEAMSNLPPAERRVAEIVLASPEIVHRSSIGQVADLAQTSGPTVLRFARRLGFAGFADLKIALAADHGRASQFGRPSDDANYASDLDRAVADDIDALRSMGASVSLGTFDKAAQAIASAPRVFFIGAASSGALADLAMFRFTALGIDARSQRDPIQLDLDLHHAPQSSALVAISHTGATRTTVQSIKTAAKLNVTTIAITSHAGSALTEHADIALITGTNTSTHRLDMFTNRVEHLSLLGALHDRCTQQMSQTSTAPAHIVARHMD